MTMVELVLSAVAIVVAAALFTNAVELLGERLNLGQGAVGSVLAAVGTALPETMIPLVAVISIVFFGGGGVAGEIGIGAILGAPFLLATLAMFVVGIAIQSFQRRRDSDDDVVVDREAAVRDLIYFLGLFTVGVAAGNRLPALAVEGVFVVLAAGAMLLYLSITIQFSGPDVADVTS